MKDRFELIVLLFCLDDSDPRKVIVKKLSLLVADRDPMELDLSGDISKLKKNVRDL